MARVYVDEYDKVAAIVRGDNRDEFGLFECQQRLLAWCSAAQVLKRQRDEAEALLADAHRMRDRAPVERNEALGNLSWLVHLHHDISRGGGVPEDSEWKEALDTAMTTLDKMRVE